MNKIVKKKELENVHTSEAARRRLKKRYGAERRFKLMGFSAIILTAFFLLFLVGSIFKEAWPAWQQYYVTVDVDLTYENLKLKKDFTPEDLANVSYNSLSKNAIRSIFPHVKGRKDKRVLSKILSADASNELRRRLVADPSLVDKKTKMDLLLSDDADLYFKGGIVTKQTRPLIGIASPSGVGGQVKVLSTVNEFSSVRRDVLNQLKVQAQDLKDQAEGKDRRIASYENQIKALPDSATLSAGDEKTRIETRQSNLQNMIETEKGRKAALLKQAESLLSAGADSQSEQILPPELPSYLLNINGGVVKIKSVSPSQITGEVLQPLTSTKPTEKGNWSLTIVSPSEKRRHLSDKQITWFDHLQSQGQIKLKFNSLFFTNGASREAEVAGIWGAVVGSFYTMLVTLAFAFPIGVGAAIYLEEFAPKNKITDLIEVNINNLAAVPSIVFGLLGLAVFLNWFNMPRSAPVVGGIVLGLMTLPTIIIATRAALKAVPPSIRQGALGLGASKVQTVFQNVLPLAMPGILTGTIIGMAQALGETAPLLMIGMVAFIVDVPGASGFASGFFDAATVLPVQIYMWADFPEIGFRQKTSAAIVVLLLFLVLMNLIAVLLRKRFERRW